MAEINIDRIGSTSAPLPSGNLQIKNGLPIDATLQIVSDVAGNDSVLKISTEDVTNNGGGGIMSNTAFGDNALIDNTTGGSNTSIGQATLRGNTTGGSNTAIGHESLRFNITGSNNTALGRNGLFDLSSGSNNTSVGQNTGLGITTGSNNTILGAGVTGLGATLANNIIIADGQGNRRINVDNVGNVGIGTNTPTAKLHSFASSGSIQTLLKLENDSVSASSGAKISFTEGGTERAAMISQIGSGTTPYLAFENNGAERMRITSAGNVGIGTSTPSDKLSIITDGNTVLEVGSAGTGIGARILSFDRVANVSKDLKLTANLTTFNTGAGAGLERMRITNAGNVSIGTIGNNAKLQISETTATRIISLTGNNNTQGFAQNIRVVRQYSVVTLGTILTIPFVSQGSLNSTTFIRIIGHSARFNNSTGGGLPFAADIGVGHLSIITSSTVDVLSSTGNITSITAVGSNLLITFTTAYTNIGGDGIYITLEYMTNNVGFSIDVPNIALN